METLGLLMGSSFSSGLNLYATAGTLGLLHYFEVITLPSSLDGIAHPTVWSVAILLYIIEFVVDKPWVTAAIFPGASHVVAEIWGGIHLFVRPISAAIISYGAASSAPEYLQILAGLLGLGIGAASQGAKTCARNMTKAEPLSDTFLSFGEDGLALVLVWFAVTYPITTIILVTILVIISVVIIVKFIQVLIRGFKGIRDWVRKLFRRGAVETR